MDIGFHEHTIISIAVKKEWDYINITRDYIGNFLFINKFDEWTITKVEVSISELLENAVQHSSKNSINLALMKKEDADGTYIVIQVKNYANTDHASDLLGRIDEMTGSPSLEYYIKCLRESKTRKKDSKTPGCGLARIYHEGQALLQADYDKAKEIIQVESIIAV